MIRSRQIAADLGLQMKIGDVEYQGDGNKAIFYYIADERVDFRQLIKVLAEAFRVRIEMKQIGARQEAGRIGGIGPCGRELCCATWMTNFVSVSTSAARYQDISLNPQKLAGQCAKLKCCLNYEVDAYVECQKRLPSKEITLETQDATYYYFKADILKGTITYSTDKSFLANEATITARRAFEIINMNKHGEKPEKLQDNGSHETGRSKDLLEQESLTRFDKSKNAKNRKKKKADAPNESRQGAQPAQPETQTEEANGTTKRNEGRQNESRKKERNNRNNGGNQENNGNRQRQEKQEKPQKAQQQPAPQKNLPLPITAENNMQNPQDNRRDDKNNNRRRERNNRHRTKRHNDNETGNGNPDPTPQA